MTACYSLRRRVTATILLSAVAIPVARAHADLRAAKHQRAQAVEAMIAGNREASVQRFIDRHVAEAMKADYPGNKLIEHLQKVRTSCARAGGIGMMPHGRDGVRLEFHDGNRTTTVKLRLEPEPPHKIVSLDMSAAHRPDDETPQPKFTWDTLSERLDQAEAEGFSGTVLVVREGKTVLHEGYGLADRERKRPVTTDTLFAIGSTPIDFTKAAVLKLEEMGRLELSERIDKYLPNVPEDKQAITIEQLMTGRSGLPNFHHIPGVDQDYDLTYIDRATALKRIFGQELLFPPGSDKAHSHSAWGVLAAIVENVSQQSYGGFLAKYFFEPAGMKRTGFFGKDPRFEDANYAVGYGRSRPGKINTPRHWGETSWLVMGSGGMFSTPGDLYTWMQAIRNGTTLSPASARRYWSHGALSGGNDRGFLTMYTEGPNTLMVLCSNTHESMRDQASILAEALAQFVLNEVRKKSE